MEKSTPYFNKCFFKTPLFLVLLFLGFQNNSYAFNSFANDTLKFKKYKGKVIDSKTKKRLVSATLSINGTHISTITNTQGKFSLKVPKTYANNKITVSYLGYTSKVIDISDFKKEHTTIKLETYIEELSEIKIVHKNARELINKVLEKKAQNYYNKNMSMTAFYRETIKKRRSYISLSEAVIAIDKQPYFSGKSDIVKLYKARKSTNYKKLDTIALKLKGGPYNSLYVDIVKYPVLILNKDILDSYHFTFKKTTKIDNRPIYVVHFTQKSHITIPLYYGELYIDAQSLALTSAHYKLNLSDREKTSRLFIVKKPKKANVYPIEATYHVNYRVKNGRWYFGYSKINLGFKINWHKKLFNATYHTTIEMVVTNWKRSLAKRSITGKERLKKSVIIGDEASGFSDPNFWGKYNVIEPEKSINSAIKKIKKQLKKMK